MHVEFYTMSESHGGRRLLQSPEVKDAVKIFCNASGLMLLAVEDITVLKDGKNTSGSGSWSCQVQQCTRNASVYVIYLSCIVMLLMLFYVCQCSSLFFVNGYAIFGRIFNGTNNICCCCWWW